MTRANRELTAQEKRRIRKLVTSLCANYDAEYGCLPLDCDCYMFGICYRNSGLCRYFREAVLPNEPELGLRRVQGGDVLSCQSEPRPHKADTERRFSGRDFQLSL